MPPAFPPQDIVGRWGLAAYHKDEDRARTEAAAADQCKQPYIITLGPTGGVMMHLADQATPTELRLKGAPGHRTFIGPAGRSAGQPQDREVVYLRRPRADRCAGSIRKCRAATAPWSMSAAAGRRKAAQAEGQAEA